jgi:hypothetical protein
MKSILAIVLASTLAILGLALLGPVSASAQDITLQTGTFKVPFSFMVGDKTLPAADYRVEFTHSTSLVRLRNSVGFVAQTMTNTNDYRPDQTRQDVLRFQHVGDTWILQTVMVSGNEQYSILSKSEERLIMHNKQKQIAKLDPADQQTIIATVADTR